MLTLRQKIFWFALASRIATLILQFWANLLIPDHDAKGVFRRPFANDTHHLLLNGMVNTLLGGLDRWDAQYFLHIAEHGYVYENTVAFFPLFPLAVRFASKVLGLLSFGVFSNHSLLLISGTIVNVVCFVKAADVLFTLSTVVLKDLALAYRAALLFCINPATVFFSAYYSETLFAFLAFYGMLHTLEGQYSKLCAIPFGLAAATRSNGILNIGFILHSNLKQLLLITWPQVLQRNTLKEMLLLPFKLILCVAPIIEACSISLGPFVAFQIHTYQLFCTPYSNDIPGMLRAYGENHGYVMPSNATNSEKSVSHWCNFRVPISYSYVQDHYWNVGLFRYYELKQVPNFIIASPIFILIFSQSFVYFRQHTDLLLRMGFMLKHASSKQMETKRVMTSNMFVFVVHCFLLALFCLCCVHIQVTTRMLCSASPVPYWFGAYLLSKKSNPEVKRISGGSDKLFQRMRKLASNERDTCDTETEDLITEDPHNKYSYLKVIILSKSPGTVEGKLVRLYFLSYAIIGTILFSNFLPWT